MNAPADQPTVIIRKPSAVLWVSALFALPFAALTLFVPRFRIFGVVFVILTIIRFARQTLSVRVTDNDVVLQAPFSRKRFPLRDIKHVELADVRAAFGATTPSVRLDFFESPPVQISGFLIDETDALYKAVLAAWQRVQPRQI
jgi:hypothetical protein